MSSIVTTIRMLRSKCFKNLWARIMDDPPPQLPGPFLIVCNSQVRKEKKKKVITELNFTVELLAPFLNNRHGAKKDSRFILEIKRCMTANIASQNSHYWPGQVTLLHVWSQATRLQSSPWIVSLEGRMLSVHDITGLDCLRRNNEGEERRWRQHFQSLIQHLWWEGISLSRSSLGSLWNKILPP